MFVCRAELKEVCTQLRQMTFRVPPFFVDIELSAQHAVEVYSFIYLFLFQSK